MRDGMEHHEESEKAAVGNAIRIYMGNAKFEVQFCRGLHEL